MRGGAALIREGQARPATWLEFALRCILVAALFTGADMLARATISVPAPRFDDAYRLPANNPLSALPGLVDHIRTVRRDNPSDLIVVFLGASPTYGIGIRESLNTFPAAFQAAAASDSASSHPRVRVFNLAASGLLIADQYFIARAVGDAADAYVVQLTYQTFDPKGIAATKIRHPDLPVALGLDVSAQEARVVGLDRRTVTAFDAAVDAAARSSWFVLRNRDAASQRLFGADPAKRMYALATGRGTGDVGNSVSEDDTGASGVAVGGRDPTTPFDELDPALQMVAIARASENSRFALGQDNSEVAMLGRLADLLHTSGRRAVFFLAPMNEEVLSAYEALDESRYAENTEKLWDSVSARGFPFLDYHTQPFLTSTQFVDLTHTTDEGGKMTGERLWADTRAYLSKTAPR